MSTGVVLERRVVARVGIGRRGRDGRSVRHRVAGVVRRVDRARRA